MNLGRFIGDQIRRVKSVINGFDQESNVVEKTFIDYNKIEKAKAAAVGTLSKKTGLVKQADGTWKKQSVPKTPKKDNTTELRTKYKNGSISPDELIKLKSIDNKAGITSAMLLDDIYMTPEQLDTKKKMYATGFNNFDYAELKGQLDNLFGGKGDMNIAMQPNNEVKMVYEYKGNMLERYFSLEEDPFNGKQSVKVNHYKFELDKKLQAKGYGKEVMRLLYDQYKKSNITFIDTLANMNVGGYAWAKYGFSMQDKMAVNMFLNSQVDELSQDVKKWEKHIDELRGIVDRFYEKNPPFKPFPMRMIANYTDKSGNEVGKDLLMGTEWDAQLNLGNPTERMIFERYLDNNKVKTIDAIDSVKKFPKEIKTDAVFKNEYNDADSTYPNFIKTLMDKGVNNEDEFFRNKDTEDVPTFNIHPTKPNLSKERILNLLGNEWEKESYPLAIKDGDDYYIVRGHNRVATDILLNKDKIKMKIYEL